MDIPTFSPREIVSGLGEMEFANIANFNTAHIGVFWTEPGGNGPWELHPDSEEVLHILEGKIDIEVLPVEGPGTTVRVEAGSFVVVPQGCWHRHHILERTQELYLSPALTEHSMDEDPRIASTD